MPEVMKKRKKRVSWGGAVHVLDKREGMPWYTKVKRELDMRDRMCAQRDPNDVYKRPQVNPYSYKSVEEFKKKHPFNKVKDCKYKSPGEVDVAKDPYGRYYKEVGRKKECDSLGGVWTPDAVNRKYRYEDGVCWKNPKTAYCSKYEVRDLLRHGHDPKAAINRDALTAQGSKRCNMDPKCTWVKTKTAGDCFDLDTANKIKRKVTTPPEEMPVDITGDRGGIEQFLYDFYARGEVRDPRSSMMKIMRPVIPPATTPLEGTGNRCKQGGGGSEDVDIDIYGRPVVRKSAEERMKIPGADEKVDEGEDDAVAMTPSLSQSVINMIMKNWALKEAKGEQVTNRGLLAWHSTGSGKCHAKDTPILMFDGSVKMVQDVEVGDRLMGDDSTPRVVTSLARGQDTMYKIEQAIGEDYVVNSEHILCLLAITSAADVRELVESYTCEDGVVEIEVRDFLKLSEDVQRKLVGYQVGADFQQWPRGDREANLASLLEDRQNSERISENTWLVKHDVERIKFLARSLGHMVTRLNDDEIMVKLRENSQEKILQEIRVHEVGSGEYFGFTIDRNQRYLLGDFTVTHNTCTAAGVMDAYWGSKRDIVFASSLDALASNPPSNFHECLLNLYPEWQGGKVPGKEQQQEARSRDAALGLIADAFERRGVRFLSFAKLSNRVKKTVESGVLLRRGGAGNKREKKGKKKAAAAAKGKKSRKAAGKEAAEDDEGILDKVKRMLGVNKTVATKKKRNEGKRGEVKIDADDVIDLNNTVLIVDEVHNLFRPLPTQRVQHEYLKAQLLDPTRWPGLKIVILSATPGDSIEDVLMLLNMIRDPTHPAIRAPRLDDAESISRFKDDVRGLISYFEMSSDRTRFPVVTEEDPVMMPMDAVQFEKYVEAYLKTVKEKKAVNYDKLAKENMLNKYWAPARKYSNMLYTFEKGMKLTEFSSKLPALLEKIAAYGSEKHYVYSAFSDNRNKGWSSQGILAIANVMEKELGYRRFSLDEVKFEAVKNGAGKTVGYNVVKMPPPGKRFMLVTLKELGGDSSDGKVTGAAGERLKKMLKVFNHPDNRYGEIVHVMLASNSFNEGIDLKAVRHIHFFEPLVTMASDKQTVGRAARFCSHADLDKDKGEWTVNVHRYMSYYPVNIEVRRSGQARVVEEAASGPTADEREKMVRLEARIAEDRKGLGEMEKALGEMKGVTAKSKDADAKARKEDLKAKVKLVKDEIKRNEAAIKAIAKAVAARDKAAGASGAKGARRKKGALKSVDADSVKMIDQEVFLESRERVKELMVVYQCMKEAAIDCRLLQKFHALSGNNMYKCEAYEKKQAAAAQASGFESRVKRFFGGGVA